MIRTEYAVLCRIHSTVPARARGHPWRHHQPSSQSASRMTRICWIIIWYGCVIVMDGEDIIPTLGATARRPVVKVMVECEYDCRGLLPRQGPPASSLSRKVTLALCELSTSKQLKAGPATYILLMSTAYAQEGERVRLFHLHCRRR